MQKKAGYMCSSEYTGGEKIGLASRESQFSKAMLILLCHQSFVRMRAWISYGDIEEKREASEHR